MNRRQRLEATYAAFNARDIDALRFFEQTGHALTVEEAGPEVQRSASRWLRKRGF